MSSRRAGWRLPPGRRPRRRTFISPRVLLVAALGMLTAIAAFEYEKEDTAEGHALQSRRSDDTEDDAAAAAAPPPPPACARLTRRDAVTGQCVAREDLPRCVEGAFPMTTPLTITRDAIGGDGKLAVADFSSGERGYLDRLRWKQLSKPPRVLTVGPAVRPLFPNRAARALQSAVKP